jgi:hypothetical protein
MPETVDFIVGNTYEKIPHHLAKTSRRGGLKKVHDVTVFVDIVDNGNPDIIQKVTFDLGSSFDPEVFTCTTPVKTKTRNGMYVWRFGTRQQVYGPFTAEIKIRGAGGTAHEVVHEVVLQQNSEIMAHREPETSFTEYKRLRPLSKTKLPYQAQFGIELELTSASYLPAENVASYLEGADDSTVMIQNYSDGRTTSNRWKIVPDSSIMCSTSQPDCNKFELVSPPLSSGDGLGNVHTILKRMGEIQPRLKVNKSMGFHVHVDVSSFTTSQLVKVCQQFVKYEDVIDLFMPQSRRTGSSESNAYFQSNRQHVYDQIGGMRVTNRGIHDALAQCQDMNSLAHLMNGTSRYFKLNMQNLVTGRQPTLEFRQHSATMKYEKVGAWIRFCVFFCWNSAKLRSPTPFREGSNVDKKFTALFQFVIKDRALRDYYSKRLEQLVSGGEDDDCACCSACAAGTSGHCPSKLY